VKPENKNKNKNKKKPTNVFYDNSQTYSAGQTPDNIKSENASYEQTDIISPFWATYALRAKNLCYCAEPVLGIRNSFSLRKSRRSLT
jgi:hypothetical protein